MTRATWALTPGRRSAAEGCGEESGLAARRQPPGPSHDIPPNVAEPALITGTPHGDGRDQQRCR